ncbi:thermonuclease family protein [Pseudonocardia sp. C8]|uniref:thermonuclease family protein n=1 Tax=Pseudonocardia sp. C8 TaxID=2762759 RepID=UPI001642D349|nr:thermonuclease family protein [Pseudonocardia sp. C8]MBC3190988.1 thermonuclease family protein [Pseudonocardia sp. C8]
MVEIAFGFRPETRRVYDAPLLRGVDGDTVNIDQSVRMVSIDTPETHVGGSAPTAQATLERCRQRLETGVYDVIDAGLRAHLLARLTADAAARHLAAGARAGQEFARMRAERLVIDPVTGVGKVGVVVTGEVIEENGRLLAYVTPWLKAPLPPPEDPRRRTFNLQLVETGWAALFPIYPSLPRDADLTRAMHAAETAWAQKLGAWAEFGADLLLGYEYRACLKLGAVDRPDEAPVEPGERVEQAFRRVCVDVRTRTILGRFGYHQIDPPYRLWVWQDDLDEARRVLQLVEP